LLAPGSNGTSPVVLRFFKWVGSLFGANITGIQTVSTPAPAQTQSQTTNAVLV